MRTHSDNSCFQSLKSLQSYCHFLRRQRHFRHRRKTTIISLLVEFDLRITHKLRTPLATKTIKLMHHGEEPSADLLTKLPTKPGLIVIIQRFATHTVDVPSHIEKQFEVVTRHLRIMHIHNPELSDVVVIGLTHLIIYQSGLGGRQPEIVVWTPPIAQVIIHTAPTLSQLFFGIRQSRHIAIVIVAPHQRHIVGHFQSLLIEFQHLLIRHKHLHLLLGSTDILMEQFLLVVDHLLQTLQFLLCGLITLHRPVVDAPHADGEHIIL